MPHTYIIAEIGQNHNGSVETARRLIDMAALSVKDELWDRPLPGVDAVKLTKRDLARELAGSMANKPYDNPHAYGETYGAHRAALELTDEEHAGLCRYARDKGLGFIETLCAPGCLSLLKHVTPDRLKVASRDLTNLPLLESMAETKIPMILSTGMASIEELDEAVSCISRHQSDIAILHCLSQYPADYRHIHLRTLDLLKRRYPEVTIGYSDHSIGIMVPVAAVAMGAEIIEKHITLDRGMKGSDHYGSLEADGLHRMTRDIRNLELSFGRERTEPPPVVRETRIKLERSVATKRYLPAGHPVSEEDLCLLSPGDGLKWSERNKIVGKRLLNNLPQHEIIYPGDVE